MTDIIQIQTTTDQQASALTIAQDLVDRGLAACVQVGGPITSIYRWAGKTETAAEWVCSMKTRADLFPAVERRIRHLHSYQEPEIVAFAIVDVSPSYLNWLKKQLSMPDTTS